MTTIIVKQISNGHQSTQHYQNREEAIKAAKWYVSFKENGVNKYRAIIQKTK